MHIDSGGSLSWSETYALVPLQKKVLDVEQSDGNHLEVPGMLPLPQLGHLTRDQVAAAGPGVTPGAGTCGGYRETLYWVFLRACLMSRGPGRHARSICKPVMGKRPRVLRLTPQPCSQAGGSLP